MTKKDFLRLLKVTFQKLNEQVTPHRTTPLTLQIPQNLQGTQNHDSYL